ncbi:hypothetical protein KQX54_010438 [Cotesia glomerata]|uniref:Uncharacterized protein n=1 Tax=Cotesia glomerata TaxID=32391 RepID=A0AAV7J684_COTGL|nr:hypothetical protein KQX54_010438 [Cotesia glomerata]
MAMAMAAGTKKKRKEALHLEGCSTTTVSSPFTSSSSSSSSSSSTIECLGSSLLPYLTLHWPLCFRSLRLTHQLRVNETTLKNIHSLPPHSLFYTHTLSTDPGSSSLLECNAYNLLCLMYSEQRYFALPSLLDNKSTNTPDGY